MQAIYVNPWTFQELPEGSLLKLDVTPTHHALA
ncbi:hypothetical protein S14_86 [Shewanella sp. phage 1/4]|nr:hypothetical protein S14_86 [Shewanella sp. phage 1/4]AHK11195.1 hypothetical protein S14_86 [Shewanella sp. phage 1/4]